MELDRPVNNTYTYLSISAVLQNYSEIKGKQTFYLIN